MRCLSALERREKMGKQLANNDDLFAAVKSVSQEGIHEVSEEFKLQNQKIERVLGDEKKEKELVDISLLSDSPREWNFFPPLPAVKMIQLKLSIFENGIWTPVIVWEKQTGDGYYILSGHNRVHALREIMTENARQTWKHDYSKVPCIIYKKDEIDEAKAQELIIDTNYIQRELTPKTRVEVIARRTKYMRYQKNGNGETIDQLINTLGLKKTAVYEDISISLLNPGLSELYFDGKITRKAVLRFTQFSPDIQAWIFENFKDVLTTDRILNLNKFVRTKEQIKEALTEEKTTEGNTKTSITVPKSKVKKVRLIASAYLSDPAFKKMCDEYFS